MVQEQADKKNQLHQLGYKIFLDRYALKDTKRETLTVGDTVIVVVDPETGQREVGTVTAMDLPEVTVQLLVGNEVTRDIEHVDKPLETQPEQMMKRVAKGVAQVEDNAEQRKEWEQKFRWMLDGWKFVPGGRILAAAGTKQNLTFYNCMPPQQEVLTESGYKPIAEIKIGERVVTHRNRLRPVLHKFERETDEDIYIIKPKKVGYDELRVTGEHKVYIIRSSWVNSHRSRDGLRLKQEPQWIPANEIKPGDYVAIAHDDEKCPPAPIFLSEYINDYEEADGKLFRSIERYDYHGYISKGGTQKDVNNRLELDEDLCYLFGRWLGDGCVTHRTKTDIPSGIKIVFSLEEKADAEEIAAIIEEKFGIEAAIKLSSTGNWYDLWVNSLPVGEFFKAFLGYYSHGKRIPSELMHLPNHLTLALLRGLFQADGYTSGKYLGILLANRELCVQIHQLLLRLGYFFSIQENTHRLGRTPAYRVTATVSECADLYQAFFDIAAPENATSLKYYIEHDNLRWVRIDEVGVENYSGVVMDMEVAEDHSFVSAGVVVSNCYVLPSPQDSREGIINTLGQMTEIMSRGGGVGMNISTLRPHHAYVKGVNGRSSGSVSWGALYSFVTGLIEQGGCFGPNERIATDRGLIPAEELADRIGAGETFHAQTHRGLRRITARFRNGVKPLFEVTTARGYSVRITEDHKVAVLMDGQIKTMALKYLQPGDEILLLMGQPEAGENVALQPLDYDRSVMSTTLNTDVTLPETLDEDLAYWLGYAHGDGYVHIGKKVNWEAPKAIKLATADDRPAIRERLFDITERLFNLTPTIENGDGAVTNLSIYSRMLMEWLTQNDMLKAKSEDIRVPEVIFRSPSAVQMAFVAGYFDADGCDRGRKGGFGFDSVSHDMLTDVQQLLAANGIIANLTTQERKNGWRDIHRLSITGASFKRRFAERVPAEKAPTAFGKRDMYMTYPTDVWTSLGARSKYRQRIHDGVSDRISFGQLQRIRERLVVDEQHDTVQAIDDVCNTLPDEITSITPLGDSPVYDFEVDDVHLLSGGGVYTSNSRRGALMLILNDWHPDIFDFINAKRDMGQINNANISVGVSDKLMEAVKADADWDLVFPDTSDPDYDELWDGDLETWIASGRKVIRHKTVKAREVWHAIIESAWASAEPGVWFRERSNKMANSWYFNPLIATNPCVTGDTRIYTNKGMIKAEDLFHDETDFEAVIDGRFGLERPTTPATRVFMTGHKPVFRVETKEGYSLRATADHRFMTPEGWVELQDLQAGDKLHILNRKGGFGTEGSLELGRVLGWLVGDGTIKSDRAVLSFFGEEKQELAPMFGQYVNDLAQPITAQTAVRTYDVGVVDVTGRDEARVQSDRLRTIVADFGMLENKHQVPEVVFRGTEDMQRGYLQALFTADGGVQGTVAKELSVRLASSTLELLRQVQQLLSNFGIASRIYENRRDAQMKLMPDGKGGMKEYAIKAQHELVLSKANLAVFAEEIGFLLERKQQHLLDQLDSYVSGPRAEMFAVKVTAITEDGVEPVYDLTEPLTSSLIANSVVIHNCGEQPLAGFSVCNLGAVNLSRFYDEEADDVRWDELKQTVQYATRFLDNVIDTTPYFFQENRDIQQSERRVGLGTMGIAELMVKLGIRYGSPESIEFIDEVYRFIAREAYTTSTELAQEKGAFPKFDAEKFLESGYMQEMDEDIRALVQERGVRNVTLLTQAPTGTTGTMVNTSTGIEPFFSWVYYRKSRLGMHKEQVPLVRNFYDENPDAEELPDYFVTAMELTPKEHVEVQGAFQRWIDSAISKTSNVPNEYTVEQVAELYEYMYDLGCKGGTIYRDGSRNEQVLTLKNEDEETETAIEEQTVSQVTTPHRVYPRPKALTGRTLKMHTPFGTAYITMNCDENGHPFEVFITAPGKAGSDLQADAEGLGRMISLSLRTTAPQNRTEMLKLVIDQLRDIGGTRSVGFGPERVTSLPDAVARALEETFFQQEQQQQLELPINAPSAAPKNEEGKLVGADMCPSCGTISLIRAEGCRKCVSCGYSEC